MMRGICGGRPHGARGGARARGLDATGGERASAIAESDAGPRVGRKRGASCPGRPAGWSRSNKTEGVGRAEFWPETDALPQNLQYASASSTHGITLDNQ